MASQFSEMQKFETGATRTSSALKYEYARFLDPMVVQEYAAYMHRHRYTPDGGLREPDNWKHGIPTRSYMDSIMRHTIDLWLLYEYGEATRPEDGKPINLKETLCALMFNAMGWLFEVLKGRA